ncbi:hypothetical protein [Streptomyces sp. DSM 40750]|uniref:hypothetical protein n=1 Tax=Streptomyces sp. DSM 40750 TaxID=2801030 RepID=UPI00214C6D46|nr:hypothetical protein [Streptomyces sp. DSM 40750]UUU21705.1 hypothetical protein JIX55_15985 [Streptomyces sp. DSM 40750]
MNQQHPQQQPGWGQQQPQQPPYPQQPGWGAPPPPPKKTPVGMIVGFGCLGIVVLFVFLGIVGAVVGGDSDSTSKGTSVSVDSDTSKAPEAEKKDDAPAAEEKPSDKATSEKPKEDTKKDTKKPVVTFKVWGTAPAGVLGPLDITYGSDSDTRQGKFTDGKFTATLPLDDDAMYFSVMAQLQGEGDINCSITVDGHTEKAHASGGYNICHAQANAGLLGGWD